MSAEDLNIMSEIIIGKAIQVHRELGPGLLESAYESCLMCELLQTGFKVDRQKSLLIIYKGTTIDCGYRLDMVIEDAIIIEIKSIEKVHPVHKAQLLSYLRLSGLSLGLLINFNVEILKQGIHRVVNNFNHSAASALKSG